MKPAVRIFFIVLVIGLFVGCGGKKSGIEGKVLDGKGQPMSGVKIIAKQVQPIKGYERFETTTGSDGVFLFKELFPASEYSIFPLSDKWKMSAEVNLLSGPEGQTSLLPSPITIRFTVSSDGIITDNQSGLQWVPAQNQRVSWFQAQDYAQNLSLGGGGWRLPTRSELKNIYNKLMKGGADPVFHINKDNWAWASETRGEDAWTVNFRSGNEYLGAPSVPFYAARVLAVRSAK
ncbi:MAG: DUF1566 domain-containing protein [Proteobacteria bacterium]|nr:DUF1566 domain-containing protein [Pseudomonadota bacterium]